MMESTFMIQGPVAGGSTLGTVFVIGRPVTGGNSAQFVMVTAGHVLEEIQGDNALIHLRRRTSPTAWVDSPVNLRIRENGRPLWTRNPTADVAVMYIALPNDAMPTLIATSLLADDKMISDFGINLATRFDA